MRPKVIVNDPARDFYMSPPYVARPLFPFLEGKCVWESACGEKTLLTEFNGEKIETDAEFDFFSNQPERWDIQVTNPPYTLRKRWIERSYALGKPFCLLIPIYTLGTKSVQRFWGEYGLPYIIFFSRRINFNSPFPTVQSAPFSVMWYCHGIGESGRFTLWNLDQPNS